MLVLLLGLVAVLAPLEVEAPVEGLADEIDRGDVVAAHDQLGGESVGLAVADDALRLEDELDSLELDQLTNRAREEGVSPSDIEQANYNRQTIKDLIIQKIVEKETKETLERMRVTDRAETLESSLAATRRSNEEAAARINSENQEQTTTIMTGGE